MIEGERVIEMQWNKPGKIGRASVLQTTEEVDERYVQLPSIFSRLTRTEKHAGYGVKGDKWRGKDGGVWKCGVGAGRITLFGRQIWPVNGCHVSPGCQTCVLEAFQLFPPPPQTLILLPSSSPPQPPLGRTHPQTELQT